MEPKIQKISYESQSSSQMVASLVDVVLINIFLRLPVKSLIRFKSVSKHWQSLISDPGFTILRNPNPNPPATGLIFPVPTNPYAYFVSLDSSPSPRIRTLKCIDSWPFDTTTIKSSCNGLILMCGSYVSLGRLYEHYVCNPTTNKYFKLPRMPDKPDCRMCLRFMCLAFDPSKSPHYKVVCSLMVGYGTSSLSLYQFLVYSSETGCWRKSCVEPFQAANVNFRRGVYWNGAIHWVSKTNTGKSIYFNPDEDRMSREIMPTPPIIYNGKSPYYYFGESCGHLHYIEDCCSWVSTEFVVYELRRDYSEWFVKYRIKHDPCYSVDRNNPLIYLWTVVRGKSDDDSFSVFLAEGKFLRYNFLNKTRETICKFEGTPFQQFFSVHDLPLQHTDSLCSV